MSNEIKNYLEKYLKYVKVFTSKENYRFVSCHLNIICNYLIENNLSISYDSICEFIIYQKNMNLENSTINKRIRVFKQMLKYNKLFIPDILEFKKLKETYRTFSYLSHSDVIKLLKYIESSKLSLKSKLLIRLFLDTGMRLNEICNINIKNIDYENNCILLEKTKTSRERYVFFTDNTKDNYLIPYIKIDRSYLLTNKLFNIQKSSISSLFFRIKNELKLKKFSPHVLRHTYATILVNKNTNLEFIRITLGHTTLNTTKRYLHLSQENLFNTYKEAFNYD